MVDANDVKLITTIANGVAHASCYFNFTNHYSLPDFEVRNLMGKN